MQGRDSDAEIILKKLFHSSDLMEELVEEYATFTYNGVTYSVDSTGYCQQVETTGNVILVKKL